MPTETIDKVTVSWITSPSHPYEDRFRLLSRAIPIVANSDLGEIYAVFDGVGSAPKGMAAAQAMADCLMRFYTEPEANLQNILTDTNERISSWGFIDDTDRPMGACAGTVARIHGTMLTVYHAGDTVGVLIGSNKQTRILTPLQEHGGAIYNYFGMGSNFKIEMTQSTVQDDDLILLLTDGVTKAFHIREAIKLVWDRYEKTGCGASAVNELVELSRRKGSIDDITALLIIV